MKRLKATEEEKRQIAAYGLSLEHISGVFAAEYEPGELICMEGGQMEWLIFVLAGKAKTFCATEDGKNLLLSFYQEGGIIGDLEFFMEQEHFQANVQAIEKTRCQMIPLHPNRGILRSSPVFLFHLGKGVADKLTRCSANSTHIILFPLEVRVCSYIAVAQVDGVFEEKLTETAELLGTSYRHLLRTLNHLVEEQILEKQGRAYRICAKEELKRRSRNFYEPIDGKNPRKQ